uniref:Uncharacterized protein n=1 Tax=Moniliophthora roreri TaxID=221103 RepID=A0A0W0FW39_MONRR
MGLGTLLRRLPDPKPELRQYPDTVYPSLRQQAVSVPTETSNDKVEKGHLSSSFDETCRAWPSIPRTLGRLSERPSAPSSFEPLSLGLLFLKSLVKPNTPFSTQHGEMAERSKAAD